METTYARPGAEGASASRWRLLLILLALLLSGSGARAQVTKTLPGNYASFAAAITDINTNFPTGA
ncbi:hypothetical protein MUN81_02730 [Hymenobacter sp. 5317J-9]|uniref:hypothetical protein n=1 Tax=Hymenobacter sp. 5317J-9 TaxID=2932250 RepID=UPI001FD6E0C1|nr:hypothetical protein [Hymenobacter sp. 5317J-9]UOQ98410.1 hypothetical protein MUN81_02730 [Hymenobacter sp. 5317J-9]